MGYRLHFRNGKNRITFNIRFYIIGMCFCVSEHRVRKTCPVAVIK